MKFKYSAIGDNTQENREWLEKLGYKPFIWDAYDDAQPFITTMDSGEYTSASKDDRHHYMCSLDINCIGNPQLFQAVTAIREDSDYMQWFVITRYNEAKEEIVEEWRLCKTDIFDVDSMPYYGIIASEKATLEELTEKFKSETK